MSAKKLQIQIASATHRLLFFANAFDISSMFMEPMSPKASTSSMCLLMIYTSVSIRLRGNKVVANLDANCS